VLVVQHDDRGVGGREENSCRIGGCVARRDGDGYGGRTGLTHGGAQRSNSRGENRRIVARLILEVENHAGVSSRSHNLADTGRDPRQRHGVRGDAAHQLGVKTPAVPARDQREASSWRAGTSGVITIE
jgi:hypothetical protein